MDNGCFLDSQTKGTGNQPEIPCIRTAPTFWYFGTMRRTTELKDMDTLHKFALHVIIYNDINGHSWQRKFVGQRVFFKICNLA